MDQKISLVPAAIILIIIFIIGGVLLFEWSDAGAKLNGGSKDPKFDPVNCILHDEECR